jgi:hypothetical protein
MTRHADDQPEGQGEKTYLQGVIADRGAIGGNHGLKAHQGGDRQGSEAVGGQKRPGGQVCRRNRRQPQGYRQQAEQSHLYQDVTVLQQA